MFHIYVLFILAMLEKPRIMPLSTKLPIAKKKTYDVDTIDDKMNDNINIIACIGLGWHF